MFSCSKKIFKKIGSCIVLLLSVCTILFVSGCTDDNLQPVRKKKVTFPPSTVLKVAYAGKEGTPIDISLKRWKQELERRSYGTMSLELYPDNSLGHPEDILNRIEAGENIVTITDGAYFYSKGMYDMGIVGSPYLFNNWDEAFRLANSNWYKTEIRKLAEATNLRVISTDWAIGVTHILSTFPIASPHDFVALSIALPDNKLQVRSYEITGATPKVMYSNQINAAFDSKEINATEGTILTLFNEGYHKKAQYLLLTGHSYKFGNVVVSNNFWQTLDGGQQSLIVRSCRTAARFYNLVQNAVEYTTLEKMKAEGLTVTNLSPDFSRAIHQKAREFFSLPDLKKQWSVGLYYKVMGTKSKPLTKADILRVEEEPKEDEYY